MKRSATLKRTALKRSDGSAKASVPVPTRRKCAACKEQFVKTRSFQTWCTPECGFAVAAKRLAKAEAKRAAAERRADKVKREAMKTRGEWLAEAKLAVQRFRRLEELSKGRGCMSCGRSQQEVIGTDGWKPGGAWDGGHFLSKGARPELALEPLCIWLQCKSCNAGSAKYARKGYTVNANFEANLIAQEGQALVDWLKGPHEPKHYDIPDLKAIRDDFRRRARELEKGA